MTKIDDFFKKNTEKIIYIELKKAPEEIKDLAKGLELPVISEEFLKDMKDGLLDEEISIKYVVDGILLNLGIDKDFKYMDRYLEILKKVTKKDYPQARAIKALKENEENKLIYLRAAYLLDNKNVFIAYLYASNLWRNSKEENQEEFNKEAIRILEESLRVDETYVPSLFELGELNNALGNYIKASLYFEKALSYSDNDEVKEEIRGRIEDVKVPAGVEDAIYHIGKGDYSRAINILNKVNQISNRYDTFYYLGVSYMNMGDFDQAIEYFEKALEYKTFAVLYNDYIYTLFIKGDSTKALEISNRAIDEFPSDIRIRYNRAMIYQQLGREKEALEDLDFILEYDDLSDELFSKIMEVRESIKKA